MAKFIPLLFCFCILLNANGQTSTANHTDVDNPHLPIYRELVDMQKADKTAFELNAAGYGFLFLKTRLDTGRNATTSTVYQYPQVAYSYAQNAVRLERTIDTARYSYVDIPITVVTLVIADPALYALYANVIKAAGLSTADGVTLHEDHLLNNTTIFRISVFNNPR